MAVTDPVPGDGPPLKKRPQPESSPPATAPVHLRLSTELRPSLREAVMGAWPSTTTIASCTLSGRGEAVTKVLPPGGKSGTRQYPPGTKPINLSQRDGPPENSHSHREGNQGPVPSRRVWFGENVGRERVRCLSLLKLPCMPFP